MQSTTSTVHISFRVCMCVCMFGFVFEVVLKRRRRKLIFIVMWASLPSRTMNDRIGPWIEDGNVDVDVDDGAQSCQHVCVFSEHSEGIHVWCLVFTSGVRMFFKIRSITKQSMCGWKTHWTDLIEGRNCSNGMPSKNVRCNTTTQIYVAPYFIVAAKLDT